MVRTQLATAMAERQGVRPRSSAPYCKTTSSRCLTMRRSRGGLRKHLAHDAAADDYRAGSSSDGDREPSTLAFAITTARIYPTVSTPWDGKACTRVVVGAPVAIGRELPRRRGVRPTGNRTGFDRRIGGQLRAAPARPLDWYACSVQSLSRDAVQDAYLRWHAADRDVVSTREHS